MNISVKRGIYLRNNTNYIICEEDNTICEISNSESHNLQILDAKIEEDKTKESKNIQI